MMAALRLYGDITPPEVTETNPANGATAVAIDTVIIVTFSEAMDPATITAATFLLSGPGGAVAGAAGCSGSTATFTPFASLVYNAAYTATITTGAKDLAGNALAGDYVWSFTACPDADGDGYGDETCGGSDCDDNNAFVYPGQTAFSRFPTSNGSFDYNCDGVVTCINEGTPLQACH